jgi:L-threonylcarbamoyladenylate synthase
MTTITTNIEQAIEHLNTEDIIAIPTETVYGLAGNIYSSKAIHNIFQLKQRPLSNPLIVHIPAINELTKIATNIPEVAYKLAETFWPGPLTLLLPKQPSVPDFITAGKKTVAVRIPNHPVTLALLESLDFPLAAPSANPFGSISPTTAEHVANYFENKLELILDGGPSEKGIESTIIGFEKNQPILYRYGSISVEEIETITGTLSLNTLIENNPDAPGMLPFHYSPNTGMLLVDDIEKYIHLFSHMRIGLLLFENSIPNDRVIVQEILSSKGNLKEACSNLYAALHRLDKLNLDLIIAEQLPDKGLGETINDRLKRASKKSELNY